MAAGPDFSFLIRKVVDVFSRRAIPLIACFTIVSLCGCAATGGGATTQPASTTPTPRQQLQTAELAFTAAEGIVTVLEATNVIKPAAAAQISPFEQAAAAALAKASSDVAGGQAGAQTSLDALSAAITAYSQAVVQLKGNLGTNASAAPVN